MKQIFRSVDDFNESVANVYDHHGMVKDTIETILSEKGDIEIPEDEQHEFTFCFLDMEGYYTTKAIRLDDEGSMYLECVSDSGDNYDIEWWQINYDMSIEDTLITKCFEVYNAE